MSYPPPPNNKAHGGTHIPQGRASRHPGGQISQSTAALNNPTSQSYTPTYFSGSSTSTQGVYSPVQPQPQPLYPSYSYPLQNFSPTSSQGTAVQGPAPHFASSFTSSPKNSFPQQTQRQPETGLGIMTSPQYGQPQSMPQQYMPQQQSVGHVGQYNTSGTYSSGMTGGNTSYRVGSGQDIEAQPYHNDYSVAEYADEKNTAPSTIVALPAASTYQPTVRRNRVIAPLLYWLDFFADDVTYRWRKPPRLVKLGLKYPSNRVYRLRDFMDRVIQREDDDRYISNFDGRAKQLIVQSCDDLFYRTNEDTWIRTRVTDRTPWQLRVADWCTTDNGEDTAKLVGKWIVAVILLALPMVSISGDGKVHREGYFEPFPYKLHGYPEVSRNVTEDPYRWRQDDGQPGQPDKLKSRGTNSLDRIEERVLGPSVLCTVDKDQFLVNVTNWNAAVMGRPFPEYVFVAYTSDQFPSAEYFDVLNDIGARAARDAGVEYYWVGCSCMQDVGVEIYRISDIVRAAKRVVVAIGPTSTAKTPTAMLKQFGSRVWTFPEILLAPKDQNGIHVYSHGVDVWQITFNQFARDVWSDSLESRQLIDHFQGNLQLSHLELAVVGLKCFYSRELGVKWAGDKAYALMGLLRLRPPINPGETAFQAFARMSLLNHADSLLERLICVQPVTPDQEWYDVSDAYDAKLWDIYPSCQISGVGHADSNMAADLKAAVNDTVIVDGMSAAKVRWKSFAPVNFTKRQSWSRLFFSNILFYSNLLLLIGIILLGIRQIAAGVVLLIVSLPALIGSPKFLLKVFGGKYWNMQPWLFGVEGYVEIGVLESYVFGLNQGYLTWSPFGSPLSRHYKDEYGEIKGDDPMKYPDVQKRVQAAMNGTDPNRQRIFILINTHSMTATLFEAVRPPIAFLLAGVEGGHQRAIGVSLDWKTNTLYREIVLRMESTHLDVMARIGRVRLGLKRPGVQVRA